MNDQLVTINNVVGGRDTVVPNSEEVIHDVFGMPAITFQFASQWNITAAIESAVVEQKNLSQVSIETVMSVLKKAMHYYFDEEEKMELLCRVSGLTLPQCRDGIDFLKGWVRKIAFPSTCDLAGSVPRSSSPVVSILPGNSLQEPCFLVAQVLLSRNAHILRPSKTGAGVYCLYELISSIRKACSAREHPHLKTIARSLSMLSYGSGSEFIDLTSCDGWNYIIFGSDRTIEDVSNRLGRKCSCRKIIGYGTGLSTSVVLESPHSKMISDLLESISIHAGNDCLSTDIIYCYDKYYERLLDELKQQAQSYLCGDPFDSRGVGMMHHQNYGFTYAELCIKRGKLADVHIGNVNDGPVIHTSIIPMNKFESTLEFPAPVAAIRAFSSLSELKELMDKDLKDSAKSKNLVSSVYCKDRKVFGKILPLLSTYTAKWNIPTHIMDSGIPHQGVNLVSELMEPIYIQEP